MAHQFETDFSNFLYVLKCPSYIRLITSPFHNAITKSFSFYPIRSSKGKCVDAVAGSKCVREWAGAAEISIYLQGPD